MGLVCPICPDPRIGLIFDIVKLPPTIEYLGDFAFSAR
jgi:hypothetical protein